MEELKPWQIKEGKIRPKAIEEATRFQGTRHQVQVRPKIQGTRHKEGTRFKIQGGKTLKVQVGSRQKA